MSDALAAFSFGDKRAPAITPLRHVVETLRGAMDGLSDRQSVDVSVGWLRQLCEVAESSPGREA